MGSPMLSPEQVFRALVASGTEEANARRMVAAKFGHFGDETPETHFLPDAPSITLPLRFTLPWSALCSDNYHEKASLAMRRGKPFPRKILDARYKAARDKTADIAREIVAGAVPLNIPLTLHACVYVPDERPHDVCNFAKCCHDALQRIVYTNDGRLYATYWERSGVDVDAPRAEITIRLAPLGDR